ncbi:glycoside hydrolase family 31 protein [Guyanagaster necrorhizus]|uniref:beta-glucosidase n=1 Tax=Guyanagaster necrorhizus TaxID=856835 RepID=A0A9P8AZE5_9AGAR|nr:glycoside hydrolase family 31 protein [Guyanagaster necrorhizus MCA 3950]KAG7453201.1 glycoside hydrolase family 31 protein [Guyanagaster necrorhizus MCA 3950]
MVQAGFLLAALVSVSHGSYVDPAVLDQCSGYDLEDATWQGTSFKANLILRPEGCAVFGPDISTLSLEVVYETETRIHLKIADPHNARYEVPESVLVRPSSSGDIVPDNASIQFNYTASPFSFSISRTSTEEVLFTTANHPLIYESQYLRVKTSLPQDPSIYGLGEHTNPFQLPLNTTLTLWSRDAYSVPNGTNLYGNHPVYFEHRTTGTHGVFLLNSNGMDIKLNKTESGEPTLEYNVIGGVLDSYFLAGSESSPVEVAKQYAEVVGLPAEVPYWSFGLHQCRFGYQNFVDVANVITNYSAAEIPLETMWTDIDYMDGRKIFTVDPNYFPLDRMRQIVQYLHDHGQKYILMTDPAVALQEGYEPYDRGTEMDVWLKMPNGSAVIALVWPGVTVYPDWFHPDIQEYWSQEFEQFYNPGQGLDIDGAWIDMNEPSNFCVLPCEDPYQQAQEQALPPPRTSLPPDHNAPIFGNSTSASKRELAKRDDLLDPPYAINNAAGELSSKTAWTNATSANGLSQYNTHNLYGTLMSNVTRNAMLNRRPGLRTLVITRSTFAGAGNYVGKWLGDNVSTWYHYRISIAGMLGMASVYQVPMVGSDICGYAGNTTETLCARWAMLGGFYPFMRNHNSDTSISQEFYLWPTVAEAARKVLDMRYRLMDYIYTAFHTASLDGTPVLQPLWFQYPADKATYSIDLQFFYGDSILVSPVTDENSTSVNIYLPNDTFYDFTSLTPIKGAGQQVTLTDIGFTDIPVFIKGGRVLPLRVQSTMTTVELRKEDFEFVVAPRADGTAAGRLYVDDGVSIKQNATTEVAMSFANSKLEVSGSFGYNSGVNVVRVRVLGVEAKPGSVYVNNREVKGDDYDEANKVLDVPVGLPLNQDFSVSFS